MRSLGQSLRAGASAISLGVVAAFSAVSVGAVLAPVAIAQTTAKPEFVTPYSEAAAAVKSKSWATAVTKIEQAAPHAKSQQEKLAIESVRAAAYFGTGNKAKAIVALEAQNALGVGAAQIKANKETIIGLYASMNQDAKAVPLAKEFITAYGPNTKLLSYLASQALKAGDRAGAVSYAQKAIAASGGKGSEEMYNVMLKAHLDNGNKPAYYEVAEKAVLAYPRETTWKALINRAETAPKFKRADIQVDLFRTMAAAKVALNDSDTAMFGEMALNRGLPIEAESILKPLVASGKMGGAKDPKAERNKRLIAKIQADAKVAREGGLAKSATAAAATPTGLALVNAGEANFGAGDFKTAIDLIQKGIAKGGLKPEELSLAQLRLGIAQLKSGDKEGARKTFGAIKADNGAQELARVWTLISRT